MNDKPKLTEAEIEELVPLARATADPDESPWVRLGAYFRAQREQASETVTPRPTRKTD